MKLAIIAALLFTTQVAFAAPAPDPVLDTEREAIDAAKEIEPSAKAIHETRKLYRAKKKAGKSLKVSEIAAQKLTDAEGKTRDLGKPPADDKPEKFAPR